MIPFCTLPRLAAAGSLAAMLSMPAAGLAQDALTASPRPFALAAPGPKDAMTARVLGIIPGAGHLYAGEPRRAALVGGTFVGLFLVGTAAVVGECIGSYTEPDCQTSFFSDVLIPTALVGTIVFSVWDAGRAAHRTNARRGVPARLTLGGSPDGQRYRVGVRLSI